MIEKIVQAAKQTVKAMVDTQSALLADASRSMVPTPCDGANVAGLERERLDTDQYNAMKSNLHQEIEWMRSPIPDLPS